MENQNVEVGAPAVTGEEKAKSPSGPWVIFLPVNSIEEVNCCNRPREEWGRWGICMVGSGPTSNDFTMCNTCAVDVFTQFITQWVSAIKNRAEVGNFERITIYCSTVEPLVKRD